MRSLGAYLHVPFCSSRCGYCDFNTYTATELHRDGTTISVGNYADYLVREMGLTRLVLAHESRELTSIFFGGGTPTLLPAADLVRILSHVKDEFGLSANAEVTTEANPDSVDRDYLATLREGGFNRVSFGHQSSSPKVLTLLERTHTPGRTWEAVSWARDVGFEHVSIDLIYGSPHETDDELLLTLDEVSKADIDHVSAYSLIVEPGTRLATQVSRGQVPPPNDDIAAHRYTMIDERLGELGFQWYEVSNWAKQGGQCDHNLGYWRNHDWLGLGPGAHGHMSGVRSWNVKHPAQWALRIEGDDLPIAGSEQLSASDINRENIMLSLRLREGLPIDELELNARQEIDKLVSERLLDPESLDCGRATLTLKGRLLADGIVARLWS